MFQRGANLSGLILIFCHFAISCDGEVVWIYTKARIRLFSSDFTKKMKNLVVVDHGRTRSPTETNDEKKRTFSEGTFFI